MLEFDRRYVLLPVLVGIAFVVGAFALTEHGRDAHIQGVKAIQRSQERNRLLTELQLVVTDAESAQRGFMLTGNEEYLAPYRQAKEQVGKFLTDLRAAYVAGEAEADMSRKAADLSNLISTKFAEIDATLALFEKGKSQAMALVRTDFGQKAMGGVRDLTQEMRNQESDLVRAQTEKWLHEQQVTRIVTASGVFLNVILILLAGGLVTRDLRRRAAGAAELESKIAKSTHELSELSTYLQRVSERERSALARELHDELGGLLISIKMDLSQISAHLNLEVEGVKTRWERIQSTLSAGINLKRRVIEQLRPSLLDNMGLVAAIKWQAGEICSGAGLKLIEHYPEAEPPIVADAAIAIFRIAQEALTNVIKHAQATCVELSLDIQEQRLMLCVEDDGVGIEAGRQKLVGSHGIAGMRHRLRTYNGEFKLECKLPRGTRLTASVPLAPMLQVQESAQLVAA